MAAIINGMGWKRDHPDFRDYTKESQDVKDVLSKSKPLKTFKTGRPPSVDLREWCSPIEDQGYLGSCTANAGVGLLEYYQRRAYGKHLDASRLFLYKVTRNLEGMTGDTGAYLRTTMKALVLFGIPPTRHWPYDIDRFDEEPPAFCYAFAQNYQTVKFYRHDPPGTSGAELLDSVQTHLAARLPSMFGFTVYSSIPAIDEGTGDIPFPEDGDGFEGGHAVMAVGYDDEKEIRECRGALLIRNSWGKRWGEDGYGWLPYDYVKKGLAVDFWSLVEAEFVNTGLFA
jgi:C1A family cysteine protease